MELFDKRILIVLGLFNTISIINSQRSPCPDTFEFKIDRTLYGVIKLRTQGGVQNVYLTVNFTIATEVDSSYPGKLEYLGETREGITYRVNFPVINPVPKITAIVANGNEVCSGPPDEALPGVYVSTISLSHQRGYNIQQGGIQGTSMDSDRFPNIGFPASPNFPSTSDGQGLDIDTIVQDFFNDKETSISNIRPSWSTSTGTGFNNYQPTRFQNRPSWTNTNNYYSETNRPFRPTFSNTPNRNPGVITNHFQSNMYENRETVGHRYPNWSSESDTQDRFTPVRPQLQPVRPVVRPTQQPPRPTQAPPTQAPPRPVRPARPVAVPRPTTTTTDPPVFIQEEFTPETERPTTTRAPATPVRGAGNTANRIECGRPVGDGVATLIVKGNSYERGEWPWLVAIYERKGSALEYICSGSLVSELHVVTAAHCVKQRSSEIAKENILLRIGVFKLEDWGHEATRSLAAAHIHEDYSAVTLEMQFDDNIRSVYLWHRGPSLSKVVSQMECNARPAFINDIVVFTLNLAVQFDDNIRPVCLWHGDPSLSKVVSQTGVVAGWGRTEFGPAGKGEPRAVRIPIVSTEQCRSSRQDFHSLTNNRTLCAGEGQGGSGKGPCVGDSGGGFYLRTERRWRLRGIVSLSLKPDNGENTCNLQEYVVFTDAAQYLPWLYNHVYRT